MAEVSVRPLEEGEIEEVDRDLPLNRLDQYRDGGSTYVVAWQGSSPVGHALVAWGGSHQGAPELQDVYVDPRHRRRGVARTLTRAAEELAAERGFHRLLVGVSADNHPARDLYESAGYLDRGLKPKRVQGTITLRGLPFEVDDTIIYLEKII